eukprot:6525532-Prymnesium_polylepis.1
MVRCVAVTNGRYASPAVPWLAQVAVCRPRSASTRPRLCHDAGSSVGASSTAGAGAGQCAGAAGTCAGASGRSS